MVHSITVGNRAFNYSWYSEDIRQILTMRVQFLMKLGDKMRELVLRQTDMSVHQNADRWNVNFVQIIYFDE
jgi:hypothetical protein